MSDRPRRRKLLVASVGIASVSYVVGVACIENSTSGNLPAPPPSDGSTVDRGPPPTSGNLPAPPPAPDAATDASDAGDADAVADGGEDADAG
ncbi:MAG TPA: hypothetical protein VM925_24800 [Labilithrix sp.]|jgi:hypothetical protein|nr:hypothetical protein [Labilithrix sp.]